MRSGISLDGHWAWVSMTIPVSSHIARAKGVEIGRVQLPTTAGTACLDFMSSSWKSAPEAKLPPPALTGMDGGMAYWIEGHPILSFGRGATQK